jgi:protein-S-isoprenylcysteine O-methyltransferase Ste14
MTEHDTRAVANGGPIHFPWPPVLLLGVITAAALATWVRPLPWPGINDAPAHWIGLGFGAAGLVLIAWAVKTLWTHGTTVLSDREATALVTTGPFFRFRNPIYLGNVLVLFGAAEVTKSIWFVAAALAFGVLVTILQIVPEERHLESQFGDDYLDYKSRTRRWI